VNKKKIKINILKIKKLVVAKVQQVEVIIYYVFFKISLFEDVDFKKDIKTLKKLLF